MTLRSWFWFIWLEFEYLFKFNYNLISLNLCFNNLIKYRECESDAESASTAAIQLGCDLTLNLL